MAAGGLWSVAAAAGRPVFLPPRADGRSAPSDRSGAARRTERAGPSGPDVGRRQASGAGPHHLRTSHAELLLPRPLLVVASRRTGGRRTPATGGLAAGERLAHGRTEAGAEPWAHRLGGRAGAGMSRDAVSPRVGTLCHRESGRCVTASRGLCHRESAAVSPRVGGGVTASRGLCHRESGAVCGAGCHLAAAVCHRAGRGAARPLSAGSD